MKVVELQDFEGVVGERVYYILLIEIGVIGPKMSLEILISFIP